MGSIWSAFTQAFPPAAKFKTDDIPDLSKKVIIVTGANTGIGKETVRALLTHNAKVYIAARSRDKAEEAIKDLKEQTGKEAQFLKLDLADLKSIRAAAAEFQRNEKELHVLFNNGGVWLPPVEQVTTQNYDLQFGTNTLGHFYLTKLLLPTLLSTAKSSPERKVRVINISSLAHHMASLDFNTFKDTPARRKMSAAALYGQSKLGNIVFSNELARRYGDQGIVSISVNPGNIQSDMQRYLSPFQKYLMRLITHSVQRGALTQLYAGTAPEAGNFNGQHLIPWARLGKAKPGAVDPALGKELWKWFEEQVENQ